MLPEDKCPSCFRLLFGSPAIYMVCCDKYICEDCDYNYMTQTTHISYIKCYLCKQELVQANMPNLRKNIQVIIDNKTSEECNSKLTNLKRELAKLYKKNRKYDDAFKIYDEIAKNNDPRDITEMATFYVHGTGGYSQDLAKAENLLLEAVKYKYYKAYHIIIDFYRLKENSEERIKYINLALKDVPDYIFIKLLIVSHHKTGIQYFESENELNAMTKEVVDTFIKLSNRVLLYEHVGTIAKRFIIQYYINLLTDKNVYALSVVYWKTLEICSLTGDFKYRSSDLLYIELMCKLTTTCIACGKKDVELIKCPECGMVNYCSTECRQNYKDHDIECRKVFEITCLIPRLRIKMLENATVLIIAQ